jgi:malonyl-CoA/methylmalonyl-CoA synthetase
MDGRISTRRVAFLSPCAYAATQRGIWRVGGVAAAGAVTSRKRAGLWQGGFGASIAFADPATVRTLAPVAVAAGVRPSTVDALRTPIAHLPPHAGATRRAMIIYTAARPTAEGRGLDPRRSAQVSSLVEAWGWSPADRVLLTLPMHHVHGVINGLGCAVAVRATARSARSRPRSSGTACLWRYHCLHRRPDDLSPPDCLMGSGPEW